MLGRGLCDGGGGCLCVFFIPTRHGAERTRSGAFLPPRRDAVSLSLFLFFVLLRFVESIYIQIYPVKVEKKKKGATFYMRTGSCYVYSITFLSVRLLFWVGRYGNGGETKCFSFLPSSTDSDGSY